MMLLCSYIRQRISNTGIRPLEMCLTGFRNSIKQSKRLQFNNSYQFKNLHHDCIYRPYLYSFRFYSLAITRELPDCFADALTHHSKISAVDDDNGIVSFDSLVVDMEVARMQHSAYVHALREIIPVISLPAIDGYPDCCFVEDTAVVVEDTAVITRPGHHSRRNEVLQVKEELQRLGLHRMHDMNEIETPTHYPTCDGGDVLYTGNSRHLFVGLSNRTNKSGSDVLCQVFDFLEVIVVPPVIQGGQVLHLKSAVTHIDPYTLVVPTGKSGNELLTAMKALEHGYKVIRIPNVLACNVVSCNNTLLVQDVDCLESRRKLEEAATERNMNIVFVDTSELAKKDAALTCCSILLNV